MNTKKDLCVLRIRDRLDELSRIKTGYRPKQERQDVVLLHFIERIEELAEASLLLEALSTPLQIMCRVLCEDFFLVYWISVSIEAAIEYEDGVTSEMAKMLQVSLSNGWGIIKNKTSNEEASKEFMSEEFLPKLKTLRSPRANVEQIARTLGLLKVYDILYRTASLEVHGNTFGLPNSFGNSADYVALSAIASTLDCIIAIVSLPRKPLDVQKLLAILKIERVGSSETA